MDGLIEKIILLAEKYGVNKTVLFGSRARGDNTLKSDYDIAFILSGITNDKKIILSKL